MNNDLKKRALTAVFICAGMIAAACLSANAAPAQDRKFAVVLADWGNDGPPPGFADVLKKYPLLKMTVAWPQRRTPPSDLIALVQSGQLEAALTFEREPLLPFLYETKISSPAPVDFAWPQDIENIIFRNQEEYKNNWSWTGRGLYLRSGVFSESVIPHVKRLGLSWVNSDPFAGAGHGAYVKDGFLIVVPDREVFVSPDECVDHMRAAPGDVAVLVFGQDNPLGVEFLAGIAQAVKKDPSLVMLTPSQLLSNHAAAAAESTVPFEPEREEFLQRPDLAAPIAKARAAIEKYKNSGTAQLATLDALQEKLSILYSYEFLMRPKGSAAPGDEKAFHAELADIDRILKRSPPAGAAMPSSVAASSGAVPAPAAFETTATGFLFTNTLCGGELTRLENFSVSAGPENITYRAVTGSAAVLEDAVIDIYIDMNHKPGAGAAGFLGGVDAVIQAADAWEFALRIEGKNVSLFRSGRYKPALLTTFTSANAGEITIPRGLLRGNPLGWRYQALLLREAMPGQYIIDDYLCPDETVRQKILQQPSLPLPFISAGADRGGD